MDEAEMKVLLARLSVEHRDLDRCIDLLTDAATPDLLGLARLKKRRLRLRDEMVRLEAALIPDIIA